MLLEPALPFCVEKKNSSHDNLELIHNKRFLGRELLFLLQLCSGERISGGVK